MENGSKINQNIQNDSTFNQTLSRRKFLIGAGALVLSSAACALGDDIDTPNNTGTTPSYTKLGCKPIEFGDQALNVAKSFGGDPNSLVSINDGEKKPVMKASDLPFDVEGKVENRICVYDEK